MIALVIGLIIGFLMCIPVGPINIWVINTHVKTGPTNALAIALGGSIMDFFYFFIIMSGLSLFDFGEQATFYLKLAGILLIFALGVKDLFSKIEIIPEKAVKVSAGKLMASFFLGVIIYTSNPTLIVTMTGLGAFVKSLELFEQNSLNNFWLSLGISVGSFSWFIFLISVVHKYQETIRDKYLSYFTRISGALMMGLGLFMGYNLYF